MRRAERLVRRADAWVFAPGDPRRLAALRIGLCCVLAQRLRAIDYRRVGGQPKVLYHPLSYMHLLDRMPSPEAAGRLQMVGVAAALVAAAGLVVRLSLPLAVGCSLVLNGMLNSTGKVIYNDVLLTLCLLVLVAAGSAASEAWAVRWPGRRALRGARYGWPVRTMMIAIALAYCLTGLQKLRYSGLAWATGDNLRWVLYASSDSQSHPNRLALFVADRPALAHLLAAGTLLLEIGFPLVLFVPRLRWLFIPGAIAMHVGIRMAMGLDYSAQWLTVLVVFVDWPVAVAWLGRLVVLREAPG